MFGASYHADYATVLAAADDIEATATAVARALADSSAPHEGEQPWEVVDLRRLRGAEFYEYSPVHLSAQ